MAISELYTGSASMSTTEWSLTTNTSGPDADTTQAVIQVFLDLNALAAGDQFAIKVYEKARSGDTQRLVYTAYPTGAQAEPIWVSPSLILMNGWDVTITKVSGTDRTINWSIRKVA